MAGSRSWLVGAGTSLGVLALDLAVPAPAHDHGPGDQPLAFEHVGTFDVRLNGTEVAEIVDATEDGRTLVYTDSETGVIGLVDVRTPWNPAPAGTVAVGGEPTSVGIVGGYALVTTNTSPDFVNPDGDLVVVDLDARSVVERIDLSGQPDSVAISPDGRYAAVTIENERDEDLDDGLLPQRPAGELVIVDLNGEPARWTTRAVDLTGLAITASSDPEPEYVDINRQNEAVVSLQENNHLVVVDLPTGTVISHFGAGSVTLENVDATEEALGPQENGLIELSETITRRREPDTVAWISDDLFSTSNEGDYEDENGEVGGSRGFTIFHQDGTVVYESYEAFEYASIRAGHYNEGRSANKGGEPESGEFGRYGGRDLLVIGSERGNVLGVYDVENPAKPDLLQMLPTGIGPEGIKAVTSRGLLAVANESSEDGVPAMVTLYQLRRRRPAYPQLTSLDDDGLPTPWVAMSGLAGDLHERGLLWAVSDSVLAEGYIYPIDAQGEPAEILDRIEVTGASFDLDLEGIAAAPEGGFWLASEGRAGVRPDALLEVDVEGVVQQEIELPAALVDGATNRGLVGVAVDGDRATTFVYAVVQREWADDPAGFTKIARYEVATGDWTFAHYPLEDVTSPAGGWVGLSEITRLTDGTYAVIERDNQLGTDARIKRVYRVDLVKETFRSLGSPLAVVDKSLIRDMLSDLEESSVWTPGKLEGLAVDREGHVYAVTDNDGLDDAIGQTVFLDLGPEWWAFHRSQNRIVKHVQH